MEAVRLSDQIAKTYFPIDLSKTHQVDAGGRACTKSSKNALTIATEVLSNPKSEVMVVRQDYVHHRDSTLKELIIAFERLGLTQDVHFKVKYTPLEIKMIGTGQTIKFGAMNDVEKLKGFKPSSSDKYFTMIWFFEITEFKDAYSMQQVTSTFIRGNKPYFNCLYEFNPPSLKTHWVYEWVEQVKQLADYEYRFRTYQDLTTHEQKYWLGKSLLREIETLKQLDIEQYNHIYLGMPRKLSGTIYKRFDVAKHVKEIPIEVLKRYQLFQVGIDYGESDAFVGEMSAFDGARSIHVPEEIYHRNDKAKAGDTKDINDYVDDADKWLLMCIEKYDMKKPLAVYIDNANLSFYTLLKKRSEQPIITYTKYGDEIHTPRNYVVEKVDKRKTSDINKGMARRDDSTAKDTTAIQERIDFGNLLLGKDALTISPRCKHLISEMESAVYHKGVRKDDETSRVDALDAWEYSWKSQLMIMRDFLIRQVRKDSEQDDRQKRVLQEA